MKNSSNLNIDSEDLNARDSEGNTALHHASGVNGIASTDEIKRLIGLGASVNLVNKSGQSPYKLIKSAMRELGENSLYTRELASVMNPKTSTSSISIKLDGYLEDLLPEEGRQDVLNAALFSAASNEDGKTIIVEKHPIEKNTSKVMGQVSQMFGIQSNKEYKTVKERREFTVFELVSIGADLNYQAGTETGSPFRHNPSRTTPRMMLEKNGNLDLVNNPSTGVQVTGSAQMKPNNKSR